METIIKKLEEYKIIINLIPGYFFLWLLKNYIGIEISFVNVFQEAIIAYVVGTAIGRIASIIFSKLLRKIKIIKFANYEDYVAASKKDAQISNLLMNANFYRSLFTVIILIFILKIVMNFNINFECIKNISLIILLIIFLLAFKKEEDNITGRININIKNK